MIAMYSNPYDFLRPIKDPKRFAGRHDELKEIDYYFELAKSDSPKFFNTAVVGPRSSGKTSFLNIVQHIAEEKGFLSVKLSLNNELVQNDVFLFKEIFDGIMTEGIQQSLFGGKSKQIYHKFRKMIDTLAVDIRLPLLFGTAYIGTKEKGQNVGLSQHVLIHDLRKLHSEAKKQKISGIVLLFDECDLLAKNETILQKLRNAFQEVDGYILILSGTEKMFPAISETFSPIPRFFKRIDIGNFKTLEETKECILKPLNEDEAKIVDSGSVAEIHSFTGGSPYEINLVAHYMYKHYKESNLPNIKLTVEVLDDVLDELERLRKGEHHEIATKIRRLWVPHLKVLISLIELGKANRKTLARYMLLDNLRQLTPRKAKTETEINEMNIETLEKAEIIKAVEEDKLVFVGDQFDFLYLKYSALTKGISKFFVGLREEPIINLHTKLQNLLLENVENYEFQARFDKRENLPETNYRGQLFVSGFHAKVSGKGKFTLVSPEIEKRFYLGSESSLRFRVNIEYLETGFVTQVTLAKKEDKILVESRLDESKDKLELAGLNIILKDEIYWNNEGAERLRQKKFAESIKFFDKSISINQYFELPWLNKARVFFSLKKYDEALSCCDKALDIRPRFSEAWNLKGRVLFHMSQYETALPCFEKSVEFDPENWAAWDNRGRTLLNLKRYPEAVGFFDKVLHNNPNNIQVIGLKATALSYLGSFEKAIECWDTILGFDPENVGALINKGWELAKIGKLNEAYSLFGEMTNKDPKMKEAWIGKGYVLLKLDKNEEAIESLNKALEIDPKNIAALYNKACGLSKLKRINEALEVLREASLIDRNVIEQAKRDNDFENIKNDPSFIELIKGDDKTGSTLE